MPTYPLAIPTSPAPARTSLRLRRAVAVAESPFTGRSQLYEWPYAVWEAEVTLPPMRRDKAALWQAWLLSLRGMSGSFLMGDWDARTPRGTARTGVLVNGAAQSGSVLSVRGMANVTLLRGDYVQIGAGSAARLHMVVADASGPAGGVVALEIEPALRGGPADGTPVTVVNSMGLWRLSANDLGWDSDAIGVFGFTFSAREAY